MEKYVQARVEGETPRAAAIEAGYNLGQAGMANQRIEPKAARAIHEHLATKGASNERLAEVVADALGAEKRQRTGEMDPDHHTRLGAVRLAAELTGQIKRDVGSQSSISVTLSGPLAEAFAARMGANRGE